MTALPFLCVSVVALVASVVTLVASVVTLVASTSLREINPCHLCVRIPVFDATSAISVAKSDRAGFNG